MGCCGEKRGRFRPASNDGPGAGREDTPPGRTRGPLPVPVLFEYVGQTALTAQGRITRGRYRFAQPGARVLVDARDAPSLAAGPSLRPVREG